MKNLILFSIIFFFPITTLVAQTELCDCKADLDFLVEKMKTMPSYKKQIKGERLITFQNTYKKLSDQMQSPVSVADCFLLLHEQLMVVDDLHASISSTKLYLSEDAFYDEDKQELFLKSDVFKKHPKTTLELSALKIELQQKPQDAIEGIYNHGQQNVVGIYKSDEKTLVAVVLSSDIKLWQPGQIKFIAKQNKFGNYDMFSYHNRSRKLLMLKNLKFENGRIWGYKKVGNGNNYETTINNKSNWEFKQINDAVQYVYFGDFSSFSTENRTAFKSFYESHKDAFNAKHIIIDLRSNGGGNKKLSDPFIKLFKKSKAKLYILTNSYTVSNAEQFTVKLKKLKNAIHLGQTTYGALAYGLNYGTSYDMPSGHFKFTPTDMNFHQYYQYEGHGITPDVLLDFDTDWILQVLELIKNDGH